MSIYEILVRPDVICGGWVTYNQRKGMWRKIASDLVGLSRKEFELSQVWMSAMHIDIFTGGWGFWIFDVDLDVIGIDVKGQFIEIFEYVKDKNVILNMIGPRKYQWGTSWVIVRGV